MSPETNYLSLGAMFDSLRDGGASPLRDLHAALDTAVMETYGFDPAEDALAQLLALNFAAAGDPLVPQTPGGAAFGDLAYTTTYRLTADPLEANQFRPLCAPHSCNEVDVRAYAANVMTEPSPAGELNLGHVFATCGLDPNEVLVVRHTYNDDGLRHGETTYENVLAYTRGQGLRFNAQQPPIWLNFLAEGGRRCRYFGAFENYGEVVAERNEVHRFFDLRPSDAMSSLSDRLVTEWSKDAINWAKRGTVASAFPVIEIADPQNVAFPGFDRLVLTRADLRMVLEDSRYSAWRTALGSVQGVYLIADASTGKHYVGKADGYERILGRWIQYAQNGHGGNAALRALAGDDADHARHFVFSLLRVFGPDTPTRDVNETESHFKRAFLTREYGMNRN